MIGFSLVALTIWIGALVLLALDYWRESYVR